jgi:hypothetical protein
MRQRCRNRFWSRRVRASALIAAAAMFLGMLPLAAADTSSGSAQVFRPWGDYRYYQRILGGGFETDLSTYRFSDGAKRAEGNEPWHVWKGSDRKSLLLPAGSVASLKTYESYLDDIRFFLSGPVDRRARLRVQITVSGSARGGTTTYLLAVPKSGWQVSPSLRLPVTGPQQTKATVSVTFSAYGSGDWRVDDIAIDPWRVD